MAAEKVVPGVHVEEISEVEVGIYLQIHKSIDFALVMLNLV